MKTLTRFILVTFLLWTTDYGLLTKCGIITNAYAAIPHLINYQGRLTDSSGIPLNGSYSLTFRIYDAETAGTLLWEETHSGIVIQKGIFGVLLGSVTNLNLAFDKPYFLEIKVGNEVMSPRQRISSSGYAIRAEEAEKLGGKQPSDYTLVTDITSTPTVNKAVRLDSNAKLPVAALKVYDSGWFAASASTTYTKTHNLATTKVISTLYFSKASDGSDDTLIMGGSRVNSDNPRQSNIVNLTTTTVDIRTGSNLCDYKDSDGRTQDPASGYLRLIMLALE